MLQFNAVPPPNVNTNPLPVHASGSGPSVNGIDVVEVEDDFSASLANLFAPLGDIGVIHTEVSQGNYVRPLVAEEDVTNWTSVPTISVALRKE